MSESIGSAYEAPPQPRNARGEVRRVGLEMEFGHLPLERVLELVQRTLGGTSRVVSRTEGEVNDTRFGTFKVEFDSAPLKQKSYMRPLEQLGLDPESDAAQRLEDSILRVAREIVPLEVVAPPIPWNELQELDPLWSALVNAGAEDTRASILHAFGMQLNPEAADLSVECALATLSSYLLLEDWIAAEADIDITRRVVPYVRAFPREFVRHILQEGYAPDWDAFIHDYVTHNPTRNRPLDMLPLMVEATGRDLSDLVEDWPLVKARPTFHYRLPNCDLNQRGWSPAVEWNRWVRVERLASDPALRRELSANYLERYEGLLGTNSAEWIAYLSERLDLPHTPQLSGERVVEGAHDSA
jgi:hypothetical protein